MVKKYRISTTISPEHYEMFKKQSVKYDSQQSLLEHILENFDNGSKTELPLSPKYKFWILMGKGTKPFYLILLKEITRLLAETADLDRFKEYTAKHKPYEFAIEYYYQKPLTTCTLTELMDAIVLFIKLQNSYEIINYTDEGDHYMLRLIHRWGMNYSNIQLIMIDSLFGSYGVRADSQISDRSIFTKVYKNNCTSDTQPVNVGDN